MIPSRPCGSFDQHLRNNSTWSQEVPRTPSLRATLREDVPSEGDSVQNQMANWGWLSVRVTPRSLFV